MSFADCPKTDPNGGFKRSPFVFIVSSPHLKKEDTLTVPKSTQRPSLKAKVRDFHNLKNKTKQKTPNVSQAVDKIGRKYAVLCCLCRWAKVLF